MKLKCDIYRQLQNLYRFKMLLEGYNMRQREEWREIHNYNDKFNFYIRRPSVSNNYSATTFSFAARRNSEIIPLESKRLSYNHFYKKYSNINSAGPFKY